MRLRILIFAVAVTVLLLVVLLVTKMISSPRIQIDPNSTTELESLREEAKAPSMRSGTAFSCTPVRLWDGDGPIWCAEGPKVRLAGIAAREIDETCKENHPCPDASGEAARDALAHMLGKTVGRASEGHLLIDGPPMMCISAGSAGHNRTAAWCVSQIAGDLSCALISENVAAKWDRYWDGHICKS